MAIGLKRGWRRWAAGIFVVGVASLTSACATYSAGFQATEAALIRHQPQQALQTLETRRPPERDRVVYLLNKAMLLRMNGDYAASNQAFEEAKRLNSELSAISLREQTESFVINDATRSYVAEEYERVLVHLYEALNYIALGQLDDARVEAGQVDLDLQAYHDRNPKAGFTEDAFARYLNGMIYEDLGETSDAMIAYRKAYEAYQGYQRNYGVAVPPTLKRDLLRLSRAIGLDDEFERYERVFGLDATAASRDPDQGEVVFILSNGLVPIKRQKSVLVPNPKTGRLIRVSLPYYQYRTSGADYARVKADGDQAETAVMENVAAIAIQNLDEKMPAVTARAIARAVVKTKLTEQADRNGESLLGLMVNIAGVATEVADTRSWLTLPDNIQMARMALAPGKYTVTVELYGAYGRVINEKTFADVLVKSGRMTFLTYDWI
jgi:hypothetical protein